MTSPSRPRALVSGATGRGPSRLFYLNVLLIPDEDIPHLGDVILHQMFVEGVGELKSTNEGGSSYVLVAVAHQDHLALEVINIALQSLPSFYLDREEVVDVPPKFPPRSILVVECASYFMKISERALWERVKPAVSDSPEAGRECSTEKEIIVNVDRHLVLVLAEM